MCDKGEWDSINDIDAFNLLWIEECARVLKDDGTLWISGTLHNHPSVGCALKKLGLWIINDLIWFKRNAPPLRVCNRLAPSVELIWIAAKNKKYTFNYDIAKEINGGKQMRNLWEIKAERAAYHQTPDRKTGNFAGQNYKNWFQCRRCRYGSIYGFRNNRRCRSNIRAFFSWF